MLITWDIVFNFIGILFKIFVIYFCFGYSSIYFFSSKDYVTKETESNIICITLVFIGCLLIVL